MLMLRGQHQWCRTDTKRDEYGNMRWFGAKTYPHLLSSCGFTSRTSNVASPKEVLKENKEEIKKKKKKWNFALKIVSFLN